VSYRILFVEDDELFGETIEEFLSEEGFVVDLVGYVERAREYLYHCSYDLLLLDVKLPDGNGFALLEEVREQRDTPAIFLTSKKEGLKEGFIKGADDYLVKPVDIEELLLRIKALLRRRYGHEVVEIGEYRFDLRRLELRKGEEVVELTLKELKLLELFVKNRGRNLSKEAIFEHIYKSDEVVSEGALRVYVNALKKLFGKDTIVNIRGFGYRFEK